MRRLLITMALTIGLMVSAAAAYAGIDTSPTLQPKDSTSVEKGVIINSLPTDGLVLNKGVIIQP